MTIDLVKIVIYFFPPQLLAIVYLYLDISAIHVHYPALHHHIVQWDLSPLGLTPTLPQEFPKAAYWCVPTQELLANHLPSDRQEDGSSFSLKFSSQHHCLGLELSVVRHDTFRTLGQSLTAGAFPKWEDQHLLMFLFGDPSSFLIWASTRVYASLLSSSGSQTTKLSWVGAGVSTVSPVLISFDSDDALLCSTFYCTHIRHVCLMVGSSRLWK